MNEHTLVPTNMSFWQTIFISSKKEGQLYTEISKQSCSHYLSVEMSLPSLLSAFSCHSYLDGVVWCHCLFCSRSCYSSLSQFYTFYTSLSLLVTIPGCEWRSWTEDRTPTSQKCSHNHILDVTKRSIYYPQPKIEYVNIIFKLRTWIFQYHLSSRQTDGHFSYFNIEYFEDKKHGHLRIIHYYYLS